ncbi:hypothetical protein K470DRAFT_270222 [Piedraia hortae CBS 480.64]|uniref:DUF924-domain-containing protein n=1 Tax=Piedraia hortae CBS 480.64 TaxID=1314780 RepID=A0A6A7C0F3_9PEZI|nr:hypothetical protein K470DRAFT_270222 [Piedraia hortae CBS 480.64]
MSLDKSIFNADLYTSLHRFWFGDSSNRDYSQNASKWFGMGQTPAQKKAFDNECASHFSRALESISPSKYPLREWQGYDQDLQHAHEIAAPFLAQLKSPPKTENSNEETLLSMCILLDQIPRNIYRDKQTLPLVYNHYDRISFALVNASVDVIRTTLKKVGGGGRHPMEVMWLWMPLLHSEYRPAHELVGEFVRDVKNRCAPDSQEVKMMEMAEKSAVDHREIVKRFGRYPHRNISLGRETTKEEKEYLVTADTFGVSQDGT